MSKVVSMRLKDNQLRRLQKLARRLGRTPSDTSAMLVEEGLRQSEFAHIEFRDSPAGRQAYLKGTSLAVWEVIMVAESYNMDAEATATHLEWPVARIQAALNYSAAFPEEVRAAIDDNAEFDFQQLSRILPQAELLQSSDAIEHKE